MYERFSLMLGRIMTFSVDDLKREGGQGATEYGLVIAFAVVILALAIGGLGTAVTAFLGRVAGKLGELVPATP